MYLGKATPGAPVSNNVKYEYRVSVFFKKFNLNSGPVSQIEITRKESSSSLSDILINLWNKTLISKCHKVRKEKKPNGQNLSKLRREYKVGRIWEELGKGKIMIRVYCIKILIKMDKQNNVK